MVTFLTVLHLIVCIFLIIVVLLQAGKGGGMGIAFGGGGSQTVFGSSGAGNFLTRLTSVTAFLFLVTSLGLAHYSSQQDSKRLQRLAERKSDEKKVEDERALKLKTDLDKARDAAKKMPSGDTPAPNASEMPPDRSAAQAGQSKRAQARGARRRPAKPAPKHAVYGRQGRRSRRRPRVRPRPASRRRRGSGPRGRQGAPLQARPRRSASRRRPAASEGAPAAPRGSTRRSAGA